MVRPAGDPAPPLRRLALILDTDEARATIHISLLTNETEMATDHDLVLGPEQTGCSFALVVQTRLLGCLYWSQAVSRIGAIEDPMLDAILDFVWEEHRGIADRSRIALRERCSSGRSTAGSPVGIRAGAYRCAMPGS